MLCAEVKKGKGRKAMFTKLFKNKQEEKKSVIGRQAELVHDLTVFQYGTVFVDGTRYSVKAEDGTELCKGTKVEVLSEDTPYGSTILTVKKVG